MALVAYEANSDSEDESDLEEYKDISIIPKEIVAKITKHEGTGNDIDITNQNKSFKISGDSSNGDKSIDIKSYSQQESHQIPFETLPVPKFASKSESIIEADDEFLHKKAVPSEIDKPTNKGRVKITIPSLNEFKDLGKQKNKKTNSNIGPKSCNLLNLLPKPKNGSVFASGSLPSTTTDNTMTKTLIPDSVKIRHEGFNKKLQPPIKQHELKSYTSNIASDDSESEDDFFSLNAKEELPEVSINEINSMVAKKAAKMAENKSKFEEKFAEDNDEELKQETVSNVVKEDLRFDDKALHALVGSKAKRRKVEVNVVELSSEQVLPNKDEWLRTALAQATTYQPKRVLADEEPVPGTRKKHQITYLAHQAKTNELELQAMWAANRHTRRQTQSKYGF